MVTPAPIRTRFAPSPTGALHLGNLRTAVFNALLARRDGGRFLLRVEDTDRDRGDPSAVDGLLEDLRWLGLDWQEGPGCSEPAGGAWQSARADVYHHYFQQLRAAGHAYPCFCSRAELERVRAAQRAAGEPPRYPGTCAGLDPDEAAAREAAGEAATLRFSVGPRRQLVLADLVRGEQRFDTADIGDFVIRRADGTAAFFFSNALDDALMGVSHVLRGEDHVANTPRQCLILEALGLPVPQYGHLALVVDEHGSPLSKRGGAAAVAELRAQGYLPAALLNYLARLGHPYPDDELRDADALAAGFDPSRLGRAPARFDAAQLNHWQALAVAAAPAATLLAWLDAQSPVPADRQWAFVDCVRDNVRFPEELRAWARRLFADAGWDADQRARLAEAGPGFFRAARSAYASAGADWPAFTATLKEATGARGKALFMPLRLALTSATSGPELARVLAVLPREQVVARLERAEAIASGD